MTENSIHPTSSVLNSTSSVSSQPSTSATEPAENISQSSLDTNQISNSQAGVKLFLTTFFTTFVTIFVAEIGDKTQVTTLLMSAESQSPWIVFIGAGAALILTTLLGLLIGRWLTKHIAIETLETITAGILLAISLLLLGDVIQM